MAETLERGLSQLLQLGKCITNNPLDVGDCYLQCDPFVSGAGICIVFITYCFVWSIIGNNCSKVDQIWSIVPFLYSWHFFAHHYLTHTPDSPTDLVPREAIHHRLLLVCVLTTCWGLRLTYNFWKKGGYGDLVTHEEDYRWPILRRRIGSPLLFLLFNLTFIATYQNVLLYLIASPAYLVMKGPSAIGSNDLAVAALFVGLLLVEALADQQHWEFQSLKHSLSDEERRNHPNVEIREGFFQSGLFRFSRHPNYWAEQMMWVCIYLFSVTPEGAAPFNWTLSGCAQLILLFQGSMDFGEAISLSKYPAYALYQQRTSQCLPLPPGTRPVHQD